EMCDQLVRLVHETFRFDHVALYVLDSSAAILECCACAGSGDSRGDRSRMPQVQLGEGVIGQAAASLSEIVSLDIHSDPMDFQFDGVPVTQSEIALPLALDGRLLGVLDVRSVGPDGFDETDRLVLRSLSAATAVALEDRRLYSVMRERAEHLQSVAEVSSAVTAILDFDVLTEEIVRLVHVRLGYPTVHLFTVDHSRQEVVYRAGIPRPTRDDEVSQDIGSRLDDPVGIIPWVARTGRRAIVGDVRKDARYRAHPLLPDNTLSELAVPLRFGDHVVGVLDIGSSHLNAFDDEDVLLFELLAESVAIAIRNAGLYRSERWRRQVTGSLQDVAGLLSTDASVDEVLEAILTELERALPAEVVAVWLLDGGKLCLSAAHGFPAELCVPGFGAEGESWLYRALSAVGPTIRQVDYGVDPIAEILGFPSNHSAIAASLRAGSRQIGLLTMIHPESGRFGSASRSMTAAFASYAAVAIENARLYQISQEQAWISTVMLQVAEATQSLSDVDDVVETVVRLVPLLVGVTQCAILLWDEDERVFVPVSTYGMGSRESADNRGSIVVPDDLPVLKKLIVEKTPLLIRDVSVNSGLLEAFPSMGECNEMLLVPLLSQGSVLGAMLVDGDGSSLRVSRQTGSRLQDPEWQSMLQGVGYQVAAAIESIRLREAQKEEAYISAALLQVAQAVVAYTELPDILMAIVRIAPLLVGVDWIIMYLWDEATRSFKASEAYGLVAEPEGDVRRARYTDGEFGFLELVRERGVLTQLGDVADTWRQQGHRLFPAGFARQAGLHLDSDPVIVGVPLSVNEQVLGVMLLLETEGSRQTMSKRLVIIEGIAHQAALAVQNSLLQVEVARSERMEREFQLARGIQRGLLPRNLPDIAGWDVAATYVTAHEVGGDLYDFLHTDPEHLGVIVADVADKGLPASLFMVSTRAMARAAAFEDGSAASVLGRVNDLLVPDADGAVRYSSLCANLPAYG
ncbi:MAG: GAF domain-containing protein, partial [Anaerolineae bacterium]|nr:GAF domain-containing protein [Anaerolineae bacterium]